MAHAALRAVYADIVQRGGFARVRKDPDQILSRARNVFDASHGEILAEANVHPWLRDAELDRAWDAVEAQLATDMAAKDDYEPCFLEYGFGLGDPVEGIPPLELFNPDNTMAINIRGSVDRVDLSPQGLRVLDYKRTVKERLPGYHFQLPLYVAAALRETGMGVDTVSAGWSDLRTGKRTLASDIEPSPELFTESLRRRVWERLDAILDGDVRPSPKPADVCRACDFRSLCRYRVEADPDAALEGEGSW